MTRFNDVERLVSDLGGKVDEVGVLPDNSGFATASMPLPKDHWLYETKEEYEAPPMPMRLGTDSQHHKAFKAAIWAAAKYAIRSTTDNGKIDDYDPDAMCQNFVVGLIGYHTPDGLSSQDDWANPKPVPPRFEPPAIWSWFQDGANKHLGPIK